MPINGHTFSIVGESVPQIVLNERYFNAEGQEGDKGYSSRLEEEMLGSIRRSISGQAISKGPGYKPVYRELRWDLYLPNELARQLEAMVDRQKELKAERDPFHIQLVDEREPLLELNRSRAMKGASVALNGYTGYYPVYVIEVLEFKRDYYIPELDNVQMSAKELSLLEPGAGDIA